ncbi:rCG49376 [Rattus norvegicus]|uniref:RCG49376 n=1 Tax=Rattus norvegicus TaxID=10116 RepID=A6J2R0_RAT|nr:rCG49376 [Rattus norvegicus]
MYGRFMKEKTCLSSLSDLLKFANCFVPKSTKPAQNFRKRKKGRRSWRTAGGWEVSDQQLYFESIHWIL